MIKMIVAHGWDGEIGADNQLLWYLPKDLQMFKSKTRGSAVCMGRKTYESLPFKNGLPDRKNYVISRTPRKSAITSPVVWFSDIEGVIQTSSLFNNIGDLWVIGGAEVYKQFEPYVSEMHITEVHCDFEADTFYKPNLEGFYEDVGQRVDVSNGYLKATSKVYLRKP